MIKKLPSKLISSNPETVAKYFIRFGRIGFWMQSVFAALPIILMVYVLFFSKTSSIQQAGMGVFEFLSIFCLVVLLFTILWSRRYILFGQRMMDPGKRPGKPAVLKTLWIGMTASCLGILLSLVLMLFEVVRLLVIFLRAPQGGVPVMQTDTYDPSTWVSAVDMVGLLADLCVLAAELILLAFTLWLLFRMIISSDYEEQEALDGGQAEPEELAETPSEDGAGSSDDPESA